MMNLFNLNDELIQFKTAFEESYARGFGTLIIALPGDKLYLETEEIGNLYRFTGRLNY
jgi:hypothetical protein